MFRHILKVTIKFTRNLLPVKLECKSIHCFVKVKLLKIQTFRHQFILIKKAKLNFTNT